MLCLARVVCALKSLIAESFLHSHHFGMVKPNPEHRWSRMVSSGMLTSTLPRAPGISPGAFGGGLHQEISWCGTMSSFCSGGDPKCFGSRDPQRRGISCPGPPWGDRSGCSSRSPRGAQAARLGRCQLLSELSQAGKIPYGEKILPCFSVGWS